MGNSITENLPSNLLLGLTTVILTTNSVSSGSHFKQNEILGKYEEQADIKNYDPILSRYQVRNLSNVLNKEVENFIESNDGMAELVDETVSRLKDTYSMFSHKLEVFEDDEEDWNQLLITIYTNDDDKMEKHFSFVERWVEIVPKKLADKILLSVA